MRRSTRATAAARSWTSQGRLVGINALILSQGGGNEGLGFAAPSNIVRTVFEQIRKWGRVKRGTIGVSAQTITPTLAEALGLPRDSGVILADVFPEEPGAAAGLKVGDIVLTLNGKPMENGRQFDVNLYRLAAGDIAVLELLRGSSPVKAEVAIGERRGRSHPLLGPGDAGAPHGGAPGHPGPGRQRLAGGVPGRPARHRWCARRRARAQRRRRVRPRRSETSSSR